MSKTVKLSVAERLYLVSILNGYKGALDTLHHIQDALRAFAFSKEEQEKIGLKIVKDENVKDDKGRYAWDNTKAEDLEGTLSAEAVEYVVKTIKENDGKNMYGINDMPVLMLRDKLTLETA